MSDDDGLDGVRQELARAELALTRARHSAALWQLPLLSDTDIPTALDISSSLWSTIKRWNDAPPLFHIGRRTFIRTADLLAWIRQRPIAPWSASGGSPPEPE